MMNMELQHKHDFRAKLHIFATIGITLSLLLFAGIAYPILSLEPTDSQAIS